MLNTPTTLIRSIYKYCYFAGTGFPEIYLEDNDTKYHLDACIYSKIFSGANVDEVTPAHIEGLLIAKPFFWYFIYFFLIVVYFSIFSILV